jgi:hypothetical protein
MLPVFFFSVSQCVFGVQDIVAEIHQVFQHHSYQAEQSPSANQSTGNNNSSGKEQQARTSSTKLRGLPKDSVDVRVSKTLSWLLRHGAQSEGFAMRSDGFVRVADIVSKSSLNDQNCFRVVSSFPIPSSRHNHLTWKGFKRS